MPMIFLRPMRVRWFLTSEMMNRSTEACPRKRQAAISSCVSLVTVNVVETTDMTGRDALHSLGNGVDVLSPLSLWK